ncbi:helix-turn-helix domain-containing protein [Bacillus paranthracis]|uniref:helix-turn-helix domain-containing protein n=1 Tax=Bacillus cereus group TaxID=86661 RepID=UPI001F5772A0|nr:MULTISPECIES: helix-turn-helix transcriptional regulator [Bacillus cereus group]MCU5391987.1 helix-turn-helix domain-containing protein [Bacillus paranthracis]
MVRIKRNVADYYESTRGKYHVGYTLGQSLEVVLMQWNMQQKQFAEFTSINPAQVSQYIREKRIPSKRDLIIIDAFLRGGWDEQLEAITVKPFQKKRLYDELLELNKKGA